MSQPANDDPPVTVLTLLTRQGCHLCDEMAAVLREVGARVPLQVEIRDVDTDDDLRRRYGDEIPVLLVNGRKAFKYRLTPGELRRRIEAEQRRRRVAPWRWLVSRMRTNADDRS